MNALTSIKGKVIELERKHRIVPKIVGASTALTATACTAFAAEGDTPVAWGEQLKTAFTQGLTETVNNCISLATVAIPIVCGVLGISAAFNFARKWFNKIS